MGSTNPVFILPGALKERANIAEGLASSLTLGVGQCCTNPGLVLMEKGEASKGFMDKLVAAVESIEAGTMLTAGIKSAFEKGIGNLINIGVGKVATGPASNTANAVQAQVFQTNYSALQTNPQLAEEVFGPSSVIVEADTRTEILEAAKELEGHLTATVHATEEDLENYQDLIAILERKVGRIIINGFPTGVEVCNAMVHGGPFPATTAPATTSVGTNAIKRFARPVCYQDFPQSLLPAALQDENPEEIWRLVNGGWTKDTI